MRPISLQSPAGYLISQIVPTALIPVEPPADASVPMRPSRSVGPCCVDKYKGVMQGKWQTTREIAEALGVHITSVRSAINHTLLPHGLVEWKYPKGVRSPRGAKFNQNMKVKVWTWKED